MRKTVGLTFDERFEGRRLGTPELESRIKVLILKDNVEKSSKA